MSGWKKISRVRNEAVSLIFDELLRMWQRTGVGRSAAIERIGRDLGLSSRKAKCIAYQEPHLLSELEMHSVEKRAESAWLKLADVFRKYAEYSEARAELARIQKRQGELNFGREPKWQQSSGQQSTCSSCRPSPRLVA